DPLDHRPQPLPSTPSPRRRGGAEGFLPLSASGRGLGGGVLLDRRAFLSSAALAYLFGLDAARAGSRTDFQSVRTSRPAGLEIRPTPPHFPGKARAVIQIVAEGGPSQVDLFDPKPGLDKNHGKSIFHKIAEGVSAPESAGALMRSPFRFARHGRSGLWLSEL